MVKASLVIQISLLFLWGCDSSSYHRLGGAAQGTHYHIVAELSGDVERSSLESRVTSALERVDKSLSGYRPDSEISIFNAASLDQKVEVGQFFIEVLEISRQVHRDSAGAFNPAIKPLIELWGFGNKVSLEHFQKVPADADIVAARSMMNLDAARMDGSHVYKVSPLTLDFNGVAQGYTVDVLKREMTSLGIRNYMIEVGGEVATKGKNPRGLPWRIGIVAPESLSGDSSDVFKALLLTDAYVSTSGDYRNYYEIDGKRYSHTIDPRTGRPINHGLASVTVLGSSVAHADAWSTALMVLGEEQGFLLAEKLDMPAFFIYRTGNGFSAKATRAMQPYLEK